DEAMYERKRCRRAERERRERASRPVPAPILDAIAHWVSAARRLVVFCGAGRAGASDGSSAQIDWSELQLMPAGQGRAATRDPQRFQAFWERRRAEFARQSPSALHQALARVEQWVPRGRHATTFVTERIDGLLQRAGIPHVIELYGNA